MEKNQNKKQSIKSKNEKGTVL